MGRPGPVTILVIVVILVFALVVWHYGGTHDIEFDSERWKARLEREGESAPRWRMRNDVGRHIHRGMAREDVRRVFGDPDHDWAGSRWKYDLTWDGSNLSSARYFLVTFDEADRVTSWQVDGVE